MFPVNAPAVKLAFVSNAVCKPFTLKMAKLFDGRVQEPVTARFPPTLAPEQDIVLLNVVLYY